MFNNSNFGRIGVLMGGPSTEREISLKSGRSVYEALNKEGLDAVVLDFNTDEKEVILKLIKDSQIDVAFIALHGKFGEDGVLQSLLDKLGIPYTGSGVLASSLAMDKVASRELFKNNDLNVPMSEVLNKSFLTDLNRLISKFRKFPLVVKPATQGSSIGISIAKDLSGLEKSINFAFQFDNKILIEEYILGRELTVSILDEQALPVVEIVPKNKFFDFEAKYKSQDTQYIVPARISKKTQVLVQEAGLSAHSILRCSGFSRTDIILSGDEIPFILEVNTIPGLTSSSLLPKAADAVGINFTQLCLKMLCLAYEKKQIQKSSRV
ncbi:MAG: D-alanine--D-alanine ligase [Candidatus Omnitrophota bacterium]|nr:D-alanine--D-alanine ligase [Candidatus Omnitrophota bacterium]